MFLLHRHPPAPTTLSIIGEIVSALIAAFFASILFSAIGYGAVPYLFSFGLLGIIVIAGSFPWFLLIAFGISMGLFFLLARRHSVVQKYSLMTCVLLFCTVALLGGFLVSQTRFPEILRVRPHVDERLPFNGYGFSQLHNVYVGTVGEKRGNAFLLLTPERQELMISIMQGTKFPRGSDVQTSDQVLVVGEWWNDSIRAFGIRKLQ